MKILYAIQGTGNGHLTRAKELIPHFKKWGEVDLLISNTQFELELEYPIKFQLKGYGFVFGKNGGIDYLSSFQKSHLKEFLKEIKNLPIKDYDFVINDFEPVSAWAAMLRKVPCIALSNQWALQSGKIKFPKSVDLLGRMILNYYAPCKNGYGFFYRSINKNITTPVIRKDIRTAIPRNDKHYLVYLPAFSEKKVLNILSEINNKNWHVFSKKAVKPSVHGHINIYPIDSDLFREMLISCEGVLCAAGFGTTSEALFLGKKLCVIPQKNQIEQDCNAFQLKKMGVRVIKNLKKKQLKKIQEWTSNDQVIEVNYPDNAAEIVESIVQDFLLDQDNYLHFLEEVQFQTQN